MDKHSYTCHNCGKDYIPKRRIVQKYCSNSCRTRAFMLRNPKTGLSTPAPKEKDSTKIDRMSLAGVGNAAAGTAIVRIAENFLFPDSRHATKADIKNLEAKISKRYYPVKNLPQNGFGKNPYFDTSECVVVYF